MHGTLNGPEDDFLTDQDLAELLELAWQNKGARLVSQLGPEKAVSLRVIDARIRRFLLRVCVRETENPNTARTAEDEARRACLRKISSACDESPFCSWAKRKLWRNRSPRVWLLELARETVWETEAGKVTS